MQTDCGHIIHRLQFESTQFEEIRWTYVGLKNIFMGSVFWVTLYNLH